MDTAITNSLALLQHSSHEFLDNAGCFSCHGQCLGLVTFNLARDKGFAIRDSIEQEAKQYILKGMKGGHSAMIQLDELPGDGISPGYALWALSAAHHPGDKVTASIVHHLLQLQAPDGEWTVISYRPPIEYSRFTATALAIKGLQAYCPPALRDRAGQQTAKAVAWLGRATPYTSEEKCYQLLGLHWGHGDTAIIHRQAAALLAEQRTDGGWGQQDSLASDAYATGQNLYALHQCGQLATDQPAYQRGVDFLLRTQYPDGSWKVLSRSAPSQSYVYSGFPHGDHQFISAAGTGWATMALLLAMPAK